MIKKIFSILIILVNISNADKALKNLIRALNSNGDTYNTGRGITYFVGWLLLFWLAYWLWNSGKKSSS
jgi:hypothetical protein